MTASMTLTIRGRPEGSISGSCGRIPPADFASAGRAPRSDHAREDDRDGGAGCPDPQPRTQQAVFLRADAGQHEAVVGHLAMQRLDRRVAQRIEIPATGAEPFDVL